MTDYSCGTCGDNFKESEGIVTNNQGLTEFACNHCSSQSACGACGEWSNSDSHNCSEEAN